LPSFIIIILATFLGVVEEESYMYYPLVIIGFSVIPQLILIPGKDKIVNYTSIIYFFILLLVYDKLLNNFAPHELRMKALVLEFYMFFKIISIFVFLFLTISVSYLRKLNFIFENEIVENNMELIETIEELRATQQYLVQSEKMASLGVLTAGVAHEINNPLNFIKGGATGIEDFIEENCKIHSEILAPLFNAIYSGVNRLSDIVTGLEHFNPKETSPKSLCDVQYIIDNCLFILNYQLKGRIEVKKHYCDKKLSIIGNKGKLHQAFMNILINAEQSIEKEGRIEISTTISNNYLIVSIIDNGCGIAIENLNKLVEPFFTTKDPGKGKGLGLAITYDIIKEHNGYLEFISQLGKGTETRVKLPLNLYQNE
jgi:signal transduction histidine kinase